MMIADAHSHTLTNHAIVSRSPGEERPEGYLYSVGVHPWDTAPFNNEELDSAARQSNVVMIGETGLDKLKGPSMDEQKRLLITHIELSEQLHKPLLLHCVKAFNELLTLRKEMRPTQPWIIHGFRGKPQQALQLTASGLYLSLGAKFNAETAAVIPDDRLLIETDDSLTDIGEVAKEIALARSTDAAHIMELSAGNLAKIMGNG